MEHVIPIEISIPGVPVAKGRARTSTRGGFVRHYTPAKTVSYESTVTAAGRQAMARRAPLEGALRVDITVGVPIPATWSKAKHAAAMAQTVHPISRPDVDNYIKAIFDGLNGIAWLDDSQIVPASGCKRYADAPGVVVSITAI